MESLMLSFPWVNQNHLSSARLSQNRQTQTPQSVPTGPTHRLHRREANVSKAQGQNHWEWWLQPWNQRTFASWQESYDKSRQCVEKQRHYFANKGLYSQGCVLPSGHVQLWDLDLKEGGVPKNRCLGAVVLEKTLDSPLDSKEIKPVSLKGSQPWILIGRTDAEAETSVFWSSDVNSWPIGKVPDAGKNWGQMEKRESEDKMPGWHHWHHGHKLGHTLGRWWGTGRHGVLQSMGSKGSDMTRWPKTTTTTSLLLLLWSLRLSGLLQSFQVTFLSARWDAAPSMNCWIKAYWSVHCRKFSFNKP